MSLIPKIKYEDQGIVAPTIQELHEGLWRMMEKAFGENLNKQWSTPQGQMVASISAELNEMHNNIIELMNLVDPRFSYGVMQEAVGEIYFLSRQQATHSVVQLTFRGLTGVVIPKGFLVADLNGNEWVTTESKFIAGNGSITINAEAVKAGAIKAEVGEIITIVNNTENIDSVTNNTPAIAGKDQESRASFEERRNESVAKNSKGMNASVLGEVSDLKGVIDCYVVDNPADETITVGKTKYPLIRNSLAVSVVGGNDNDIARAILIKGGTACSFVGNTEVIYEDWENFESYPPKYTVKFIRPAHKPVFFTVEVEAIENIGYDQERYIKENILKAFNEGKLRARIGGRIVANRYLCCISGVENNVVIGIYVGRSRGEKMNIIDFGIDEYPTLSELNITIEEASYE